VAFDDPADIETQAAFSTPGVYVLRLVASQGLAAAYDEVVITVIPDAVPIREVSKTFFYPRRERILIPYVMARDGNVKITIYNIRGQRVRDLINDDRAAGSHSTPWNGRNDRGEIISSGIYIVFIDQDGSLERRKIGALK